MRYTNVKLICKPVASNVTLGRHYNVSTEGLFTDDGGNICDAELFGWETDYHTTPKEARLVKIGGSNKLKLTVGKVYLIDNKGQFKDDFGGIRRMESHDWVDPSCTWIDNSVNNDNQSKISDKHITKKDIVAMSNAFGSQVDGHHYTDMELQPLEMAYLRYGIEGLKAAIHVKIDKYITRKKDDEVKQLKKAKHCLEILVEMTELHNENFK